MTFLATRPRRSTRLLALAGACSLAVLSLSGCIKIDADVTINSDATASGTFAMELQKEAAQFLGVSDIGSFESQLTDGELSGQGLGELGTCEASESDTGFVYSCTFTDETFTDEGGLWTINKQGESIVFTLANEGQSSTDGSDATALLGDSGLGDITINVTFPGAITEVTGSGAEKTSDTTATIQGTLTDNLDVKITSEASSSGFSPSALLTLLVGLAVLALIVIVIIVLLVRRRSPAAPSGVAADGTAVDGTAVDQSVVPETVTEAVVLDDAGAPTEVLAAESVTEVVETPGDETVVAETVTEAVAPDDAGAPTEILAAESVTEVVETPGDDSPERPTPDAGAAEQRP